MNTFLFTWNPKKWAWKTLDADVARYKAKKYFDDRWSCGVTKRIMPGDRAFLMKLGNEQPIGIMASGSVLTEPVEGDHYRQTKQPCLRAYGPPISQNLGSHQSPCQKKSPLLNDTGRVRSAAFLSTHMKETRGRVKPASNITAMLAPFADLNLDQNMEKSARGSFTSITFDRWQKLGRNMKSIR